MSVPVEECLSIVKDLLSAVIESWTELNPQQVTNLLDVLLVDFSNNHLGISDQS